jgi:hypothetical protein
VPPGTPSGVPPPDDESSPIDAEIPGSSASSVACTLAVSGMRSMRIGTDADALGAPVCGCAVVCGPPP